jgi:energy-coupling factor transporter ATP-binding protein EcfA2
MAGVVDEIRPWAAELKFWEQAALEMIANGREMSEGDYLELLDYCMRDAGLVQMPVPGRPRLDFPQGISEDSGTKYRLERVFNLRNVNAIPTAQELVFGPQLTLIYGDNGSGKTSFTRPLGCAAFARGDRDVLPNATLPLDPEAVPQVDIEISKASAKTTITWTRGQRCSELAGLYVFDTVSLAAHLTRSNALSFSPSGLYLLKRLAEVTDEVRRRLKETLDASDVPHSFSPLFTGHSTVSAQIGNLGYDTDLKALEELGSLSEKEHVRIKYLETEIAQLNAMNVPNRILSLRQDSKDLRALLSLLVSSEALLSGTAVTDVQLRITDLQLARAAAEQSGSEQFKFDQFSQIGTYVWRNFVGAAKSLSEAESKDHVYPIQGDHCLLCRQSLPPEAVDLISKLWKFLESNTAARLEWARNAYNAKIRELEKVNLDYFAEESAIRRKLTIVDNDSVLSIQGEIEGFSLRRSELIASLHAEESSALTALATGDRHRLAKIADIWDREAKSLEVGAVQEKLRELTAELREFQHRMLLSQYLEPVKAYVETKRWILRGRQNIGSTHHITTKHNELFSQLVTEQFVNLFQSNLAELSPNLKVTVDMHGQKGETVRQLKLDRAFFPSDYSVDSVLSDGEKRAVALADFITEASLDQSCTGIIVDDPVTSLDLSARQVIAHKLAELARSRQVVVFTHDLAFLHHMKTQAKTLSVGTVNHWIQRGPNGEPGIVFLDNSPVCEGDYKSTQLARERYAKAKSAQPQEQQWFLAQGFGALRTSYEAFVIFDLFAGVVERFAERISFGRLVEVTLDKEIVDQVIAKMETLSRYIDAHLHSDSFGGQKPTPATLIEEIEAFDAMRKKHKGVVKASQQANAIGKPAIIGKEGEKELQSLPAPKAAADVADLEKEIRLANQLRTRH